MGRVNPLVLRELRAVAQAFEGISGNFVIVGGAATALFDLYARADPYSPVKTAYTLDIDVAVDGRVVVAVEEVKKRFQEIGYEQILLPIADTPKPLIKYEKQIEGKAFEVEFLVPLFGRDPDRQGRRRVVEVVADGIHAQQLRFLDILTDRAEEVTLPGEGELKLRVPNPGNYLVHKYLTLHRRDQTVKREKDSFYVFDILNRFAEHHEYLAQEVIAVCKGFKQAKSFPRDFCAFYADSESEGIVLLMAEYRRSYSEKFPLTAEQACAFIREFSRLLPE